MKKVIRITESQFDNVIKHLVLKEQVEKLTEVAKDVYKKEWSAADTILTLYCAKFDVGDLGFKNSSRPYDDLANHVIGSTGGSLKKQMGNMQYLMGVDNGMSDVSYRQEEIYKKYKNAPKDELRALCIKIIQNADPSVYENFKKREKEILGMHQQKEREKISQDKLADILRSKGFDPSKMKSIGKRPAAEE